MPLLDVVIVGAGMAGLICARRLQQAGYQVNLLEKSRGLGGRMATRRIEGVPIDHGARFLHPQGSSLATLASQLAAQGLLTHWQPQTFRLDSAGKLHPDSLTATHYVAPTGMSAVGKILGTELTIHRQQRTLKIAPTPANHWCITAEQAPEASLVEHTAKAIVLAIPAPQITPLLEPLHTNPAFTGIRTTLSTVQYAPCITVMAQYTSPISHESVPLPCEPTTPWMVNGHPETPFFWAGLDSSKRRVPGINVVLQSSAAFATKWLEASHLQAAGEALLTHAGQLIAPWLQQPIRWQVHRWRYALVAKPCPEGLLSSSQPSPLVACGDWCGDRQIDTALESGWTAADHVNAYLDRKSLPESLAKVTVNLNL